MYSSEQMHLTLHNRVDIKQKASEHRAGAIWVTRSPDLYPAASTLSPRGHFSSWNRAHMTEHNIHSNNYPQRDDVTCLFNFVWTGVRLILSLLVPQPCPCKESLLSFGSGGRRGNPITVIDRRLRSNTWSTHTGSGHIHILTFRNESRKSPKIESRKKSGHITSRVKGPILSTCIRMFFWVLSLVLLHPFVHFFAYSSNTFAAVHTGGNTVFWCELMKHLQEKVKSKQHVLWRSACEARHCGHGMHHVMFVLRANRCYKTVH